MRNFSQIEIGGFYKKIDERIAFVDISIFTAHNII